MNYITTKGDRFTDAAPPTRDWAEGDAQFDICFEDSSTAPMEWVGGANNHLGRGTSADVFKVKLTKTNHLVAVKKFEFDDSTRHEELASVQNEVRILRRNNHHYHVVRAIGSYYNLPEHDSNFPDKYFILMDPLCDYNLETLLSKLSAGRWSQRDKGISFLPAIMGCLAHGLNHLHTNSDNKESSTRFFVRHKDIKPSNILLKGGRPLWSDFGLSRVIEEGARFSTKSTSQGTDTYKSPELANKDLRGLSDDIFSLGCVFTEIFTVYKGRKINDFEAYRMNNSNGTKCYRDTIDAVIQWLRDLIEDRPDAQFADLVEAMLCRFRHSRPGAKEVWLRLASFTTETTDQVFCGPCCMPLTKDDPLLGDIGEDPSKSLYRSDCTFNDLHKYPSGFNFEDVFDGRESTFHFHRNLRFSQEALLDSVRIANPASRQVRMIETRREKAQKIVDHWLKLNDENKFRHVQKLKGTYRLKCGEEYLFVLLLEPTAKYDLRTYMTLLEKYDPQHPARCGALPQIVSRAMGCIAYTLKQMHKLNIAHRAIRPENILIQDNRALLGLEFRLSESDQNLYEAPNLNLWEQDLFSLGCVYLEMLTSLSDKRLREMKQRWLFKSENYDSYQPKYRDCSLENLKAWLNELKVTPAVPDRIKELVKRLLELKVEISPATRKSSRISADEVCDELIKCNEENSKLFCCAWCQTEKERHSQTPASQKAPPTKELEVTVSR